MKKPKFARPFFFKDKSHLELLEEVNTDYPINLKHNSDLIDRIYARNPYLTKVEIAQIIMAVFQSIRDFMILGKVINFNTLFFNTKLHFFTRTEVAHILPALKVHISTPPPLRKVEDKEIL